MKSRDYIQVSIIALLAACFIKLVVLDAVIVSSPSMETTLMVGDLVLVNKLINTRGEKHLSMLTSEISFPHFPFAGHIERGDVIVFRFPGNRDEYASPRGVEYVKRCIGIGGDTLAIRDGDLYVNGTFIQLPELHRRTLYPRTYVDDRLFPRNEKYNLDFFGPVVVPKSGDVVPLTPDTYPKWEKLVRGEGHTLECGPNGIVLDGKQTGTYTIRKNYLFVLGDNFYDSSDSRFWGFLPEENVIGKAEFIYWSVDASPHRSGLGNFVSSIRWNRIGNYIR